ncbi:MAG: Clp protease N-terminal domain-containing protein, partial [Acidobacteriia bacterium]|nr:Clp protease N-terminal domain-containing protein [Terriglobia bacterium]
EHIAPEHLLLGMLREKDSYAAILLREYGAELERIRKGLAA